MLNARDTVLCSYFAQRSGERGTSWSRARNATAKTAAVKQKKKAVGRRRLSGDEESDQAITSPDSDEDAITVKKAPARGRTSRVMTLSKCAVDVKRKRSAEPEAECDGEDEEDAICQFDTPPRLWGGPRRPARGRETAGGPKSRLRHRQRGGGARGGPVRPPQNAFG